MSELVGSVCIGLADIVTDGISYALLTHGNTSTNPGLNTAYVAVLSFGVVTTILSLGYRFHNARRMQAHILELSEKQRRTGSSTATRRQAEQHEWELAQTHRTKIILSLGLLSVAAQGLSARREPRIRRELGARIRGEMLARRPYAGLPMSVLNCCLLFAKIQERDTMVRAFPWLRA